MQIFTNTILFLFFNFDVLVLMTKAIPVNHDSSKTRNINAGQTNMFDINVIKKFVESPFFAPFLASTVRDDDESSNTHNDNVGTNNSSSINVGRAIDLSPLTSLVNPDMLSGAADLTGKIASMVMNMVDKFIQKSR